MIIFKIEQVDDDDDDVDEDENDDNGTGVADGGLAWFSLHDRTAITSSRKMCVSEARQGKARQGVAE